MTAETADLDALTGTSTIPHHLERIEYETGILRNPEVWPIEVAVLPGWLPLWVEIETVVRWPFTDVLAGVEGDRGDLEAAGKGDGVTVPMHLKELMVMAPGLAFRAVPFLVPVQAALSTEHDQSLLDHV
jgi:hypothetical protein